MIETFLEWAQMKEMPLPADWDASTFDKGKSFAKRIKYAAERAKKLGTGSSRVAFIVPYEGRDTVLKIAKNQKGIAQNEAEIQFLGDYHLKSYEIAIPMIDHHIDADDVENVSWIHTEKAEKMTASMERKFFGEVGLSGMVTYIIRRLAGKDNLIQGKALDAYEQDNPTAYAMFLKLEGMMADYQGTMEFADLTGARNWGIFQGRPVIIDMGLTPGVYTTHYAPKPKPRY